MTTESNDLLFNYGWTLFLTRAKPDFLATAGFSILGCIQYLYFVVYNNTEQPMT